MAKKEPEDVRLPGMEDPAIEELERLAKLYAKTRDRRQATLEQEVDLKGQLLVAMKKNGKTEYTHGKVSIRIVAEEETVKVKIKKDKEDED
ncbi:MAG TPA: hypothetical protein VMW38_25025 [Terriglobia bacterium]|nr:hypothetical protein [Terriglobia bacterium]